MVSYTITEPHPTYQSNAYAHTGRGGAGNTFHLADANSSSSSSGSIATAPLRPSTQAASSSRFYSGRGGAGNAHAASERHTLSFDEEYTLAATRTHSGHVGRGGAGNVLHHSTTPAIAEPATDRRRDSGSTTGSVRSGFWARVSGASLGSH